MSNVESNANVDNSSTGNSTDEVSEVALLRQEVDRLSALVGQGTSGSSTAAATAEAVNVTGTSGTGVVRQPSEGATVIGAASDPRGGTVLAYSDGTLKLVGVPAGTDGPALPFGSAPEGEYSQFYVDDNGNRYNFIRSDGTAVESVDNPNQVRP